MEFRRVLFRSCKSFGPFWEKANSMFFDRGGVLTGEESDSFEKRLGTTEGDILLYGTLSNLPKLFGGAGASVYTRGDTNVRLPVVNMPIEGTAARIRSEEHTSVIQSLKRHSYALSCMQKKQTYH